jgi:RHS repeat-associated protein
VKVENTGNDSHEKLTAYITPGLEARNHQHLRYVFFDGRHLARYGVSSPYDENAGGNTPNNADTRVIYIHDHLGSTTILVSDFEDASSASYERGSIAATSSHLPYGNTEAETGGEVYSFNIEGHYTFSGKERERSFGIYYFGARYLNSNLGSFISVDVPRLFANADNHAYLYVDGRVYNRVDPDGNTDLDTRKNDPDSLDIQPVETEDAAQMEEPSHPSGPSEPDEKGKENKAPPRVPCQKNLRICDRKARQHGGTRQVTPEEAERYDRQAKAQRRRARKRYERKKAATGAWGLADFLVGAPRKSENIEAYKGTVRAAISGDPEALVVVGTAILIGVFTRRLAKKRGPSGGVKHTPGRGHTRKSGPRKRKRFQRRQQQQQQQQQQQLQTYQERWDNLSEDARKIYNDFEDFVKSEKKQGR